jgi:hypothetical protein
MRRTIIRVECGIFKGICIWLEGDKDKGWIRIIVEVQSNSKAEIQKAQTILR